ncbi:OTU domain-containing protein 5 [Fistulifera solaris]|uniref:ubiquitinyl hydrolase 1 n=1 Tax=Fistulifera solaris TaxID=1519565 RepID=A0A1Z5JD93_FISSO|nr:OTU domain-containing protein 5 [Fistulifera solaris]|eukprot:GAX11939.1 OTU domain-containing protein 5 [Fistulifera solaris]
MRVLLRYPRNNSDEEVKIDSVLVSEAEQPQQQEEDKVKSTRPASPFSKEPSSPKDLPVESKKRPRSPFDSKPAAIMVDGGRRRRWDDEELVENQPPPPLFPRVWVLEEEEEEEPTGSPTNHRATTPSERAFQEKLKKERGLEIVEQAGDGNCLFRAVSLQVYGDASMHAEIRERCMDFMARDPEHFAPFVDGDFAAYIKRKRRLGVHGNNPEIQAMSELFNRPFEVFTPDRGTEPLNIFQSTYKTKDVPIRLSYHDGNHYNAVIDPLLPTAGLGLGLPGLQPGLADQLQLAKAVVESDQLADEIELQKVLEVSRDDELQRALKESNALVVEKMYDPADYVTEGMGDDEFDLEQKVLLQSLEEYRRQEEGQKQRAKSSSPVAAARLPEIATTASFAASAAGVASLPTTRPMDEYPATVQELVMNGFELRKVVHAYELIGDDFNDLLAFLMSNC